LPAMINQRYQLFNVLATIVSVWQPLSQ